MHATVRRALAAALVVFAAPALAGCSLRYLTVVIPDFEAAAVEGVQVWRIDDATGQAVPRGQLVLGEMIPREDLDLLEYTQVNSDGETGFTLPTGVVRPDPAQPDRVRLQLYYAPDAPQGWYKVSTYNAAGSSPLSQAQTFL